MANPILFSSFPFSPWIWGGATGNLGLFSVKRWTDQNSGVHLPGNSKAGMLVEPAQLVPFTVNGRTAVVSDFLIEPTELSIDDPDVRLTGVLFDEDNIARHTLFQFWQLPPDPIPMTWRAFTIYNHGKRRRFGDEYLNRTLIYALFNGLSLITPEDLARLDTARGTAMMVDGSVVVPTARVTAQSLIQAWSQSQGVSGDPRAPVELYEVGVGFTVISTNDLDNGLIGWRISEPF